MVQFEQEWSPDGTSFHASAITYWNRHVLYHFRAKCHNLTNYFARNSLGLSHRSIYMFCPLNFRCTTTILRLPANQSITAPQYANGALRTAPGRPHTPSKRKTYPPLDNWHVRPARILCSFPKTAADGSSKRCSIVSVCFTNEPVSVPKIAGDFAARPF